MEKKKSSPANLPGKPCFPWVGGKRRLLPVLIEYLLPEVVADTADKLSLREVGDFGGRYQRVELGTDIG